MVLAQGIGFVGAGYSIFVSVNSIHLHHLNSMGTSMTVFLVLPSIALAQLRKDLTPKIERVHRSFEERFKPIQSEHWGEQ